MRNRSALALGALAVVLSAGALVASSGSGRFGNGNDRRVVAIRPIIAEMVHEPGRFLGKRVEVYGLVVATQDDGRRFLLQDVSQRPIPIIAPAGLAVLDGSQLLVSGILRNTDGQLQIDSDELMAVQVVNGGGCC